MDIEIACLYLIWKKRIKKKRYWIHPMLKIRNINNLICKLRPYDDKFFKYTKMSVASFDELLLRIQHSITGANTKMRVCIGNEEKLFITLRYLGKGYSFTDIEEMYRIGHTTTREIVYIVCTAIWTMLKNEFMAEPNMERWQQIADKFESRSNFPNCLGAVDGKHVRITKPPKSGSLYYNYKKHFSIVLMAICDADYKFIAVDVGAYGKCSDSTIFEQSTFYNKLLSNGLNIPNDRPISIRDNTLMPYTFVADEAFSLSLRIMRPYSGRYLETKKKIFNYRLSRARRFVECSFGMLASKWRIFHKPINVHIEFAVKIIKCCCVLHNYVLEKDGSQFDDTLYNFPSTSNTRQYHSIQNGSAGCRNYLANYFMDEGKLPWQHEFI